MPIEVTSLHERRHAQLAGRVKAFRESALETARARQRRIIISSVLAALVISFAAATAFLFYSYSYYAQLVDERLASGYLTSRAGIYAAPRTLRVGQTFTRDGLTALLKRAGYVESDASDVWSGSFKSAGANSIEIRTRRQSAQSQPTLVQINFDKAGRIASLIGDSAPLDGFTLEPELLTTDAGMKTGKSGALSFQNIPPVLVRAILSIEDHRFFEHQGLDLFGVARAALRNAGDNEIGQGGSTITQQLVKNTYLSPERTFRRKFAEAMIAYALERRLSKQDIFALYCNEIYLGQRGSVAMRGVEQAARVFFGKDLKDLTLSEAATIAGMIQSPNRYAPDRHEEAARARRNTVLGAMVRDGAITLDEARAVANEPIKLAPAKESSDTLAPYFIDYVNRTVEAQLEARGLDERGLRVYTTLDPDLQQLAENSIQHQLEKLDKVYAKRGLTPQAALVALDPKTGNVLAMVGGRSYPESQLNRAVDARRQPGSVFKPVVYAAALESGFSPLSMYMDAPQEFTYAGRSVYRPANYGGGYSMHDVMMRTGLVHSLNVVTVEVAMQTGLTRVAQMAEKMGLPKPEPYPALALGTTEVTPLEVASAYTTFVRNGERVAPNVLLHATDAEGSDLITSVSEVHPVLHPANAYMITDMLADVIEEGTARASRGAVKRTAIAGKTGTSRDGWFVGYTPNLVCAVWVGFDDNKQLGLTGAEAALPAWTEFVKGAVELRPELGGDKFARPAGITFAEVDPETGMLATPACPQRERIAVTSTFAPSAECYKHNPLDQQLTAVEPSQFDYTSTPVVVEDGRNYSTPQPAIVSTLPPPEPRRMMTVTPPPLPATRPTRVETDTRGQRTLTNEMRVENTNRERWPR